MAMPRAIDARGEAPVTGSPRNSTSPDSTGSQPNSARAISVRPLPTSPASPTISPGRTRSDTPRTAPPRTSCISATGGVSGGGAGGRSGSSMSTGSPSMASTRPALVSCAAGAVLMTRPSRMTVTRSQLASTSSRKWVT
ncbi:hypothetical protein GCM10020001_102970 [Nonomuraea salmonea]